MSEPVHLVIGATGAAGSATVTRLRLAGARVVVASRDGDPLSELVEQAGGGSIVLAASAAAQTGIANHEAIAAAKGGVIALARSAAATYGLGQVRTRPRG